MAVNCTLAPVVTDTIDGVTAIDTNVAALTESAMVFDGTPLCVALMLLEPMAAPDARPVVLIDAAAVFDEAHTAEPVRFCVVPSVNVPVAVN